jgi:cation:H+ antiporter
MDSTTIWAFASVFGGLVVLIGGGELLVRGASLLAASFRISPLIVGLTVVAFGTSAPELGVSLQATLNGSADVAVGNVLGSNIINVLLILGLASLVTPLAVSSQLIRKDVPLMVLASLVLWGFSLDGNISHWDGGCLFAGLVGYLIFCIRSSRTESQVVIAEFKQELPVATGISANRLVQLGLVLAGLVLLGLGSRWLVDGAVTIATQWGVSELIIGLTIVAGGTSLPEAVTSIVASFRGERDIAIGNVVGSNLFNILCVLGLTGVFAPSGLPVSDVALSLDMPVMVAVAVVCLPIFFTGNQISRLEGAMFVFYYVAYTALLILAETRPDERDNLATVLGYLLIPLTLVTIAGSVIWSWHLHARDRKKSAKE